MDGVENITLSKMSQSENDRHRMILYICVIGKNDSMKIIQKDNRYNNQED